MLTEATDQRGSLAAADLEELIPFQVKRFFLVYDVPSSEQRGSHAHKKCKQFLVCVKGSVKVETKNGISTQTYDLNSPTKGLYLPEMVWATQYEYVNEAILLVAASHKYDSEDYIREYDQYLTHLSSIQ